MFLVMMCALAFSQTVPATAQDEYGDDGSMMMDSSPSSYSSPELLDLLRQKAECESQFINTTSRPSLDTDGK